MRRRLGGDRTDDMMEKFTRREKRATTTGRIIGYGALGLYIVMNVALVIWLVVVFLFDGCGQAT
jgi:hypothetical protein